MHGRLLVVFSRISFRAFSAVHITNTNEPYEPRWMLYWSTARGRVEIFLFVHCGVSYVRTYALNILDRERLKIITVDCAVMYFILWNLLGWEGCAYTLFASRKKSVLLLNAKYFLEFYYEYIYPHIVRQEMFLVSQWPLWMFLKIRSVLRYIPCNIYAHNPIQWESSNAHLINIAQARSSD